MNIQNDSNSRVAYFYNSLIGKFYYGKEHPMKPKRIAMAHNLIVNYGLYKSLDVYQCREASIKELLKFHDPEYIKYLSQYISLSKATIIKEYQQYNAQVEQNHNASNIQLSAEIQAEFDLLNYSTQIKKYPFMFATSTLQTQNPFRVGDSSDCPSFPGLFTFCQLSTGASIDSAHTILCDQTDIAINWSGGLHHAKKREASGFCYINDIVVCILELLRVHPRVLYVDIDVHHGDGVEEAFFLTNRFFKYLNDYINRVMTVSFHQYGDEFYPGSGNIESVGEGVGRYHSINVPLKPGMNDESYIVLFKSIMSKIMEVYRPNVAVVQCGADSLSHDKLGGFNLSIKGHGECVEYMKQFGIPMVVLGGGGYTIQNVSRCWAYETGVCLNQKIDQPIPTNDIYYEHYAPDYRLHYNIKSNVENKNKKEDLNKIMEQIWDYLKRIESAPGVGFHDVPFSFYPSRDMENEGNIILFTNVSDEKWMMDQKMEMSLKEFEGNNNFRMEDKNGQETLVQLGKGNGLIHKHE